MIMEKNVLIRPESSPSSLQSVSHQVFKNKKRLKSFRVVLLIVRERTHAPDCDNNGIVTVLPAIWAEERENQIN